MAPHTVTQPRMFNILQPKKPAGISAACQNGDCTKCFKQTCYHECHDDKEPK